MKDDKHRFLAGFCYSGNGDQGPYIKEGDDDDYNYLSSVQWLSAHVPPSHRAATEIPLGLSRLGLPLAAKGIAEPLPDPFPNMMTNDWPGSDRPRRAQQPLHKEGQTPPLWISANYQMATGDQLKRLRRQQIQIYNLRLCVEGCDAHVSIREQVPPDWRQIPFAEPEDQSGGLSTMKAYLMPYNKRFDDAFRTTAMKGRFPEKSLKSWLLTSIADKYLWDLGQGIVSIEAACRLELASGHGVAALKRLNLSTLTPKRKARKVDPQVFFLGTFS